MKTISLKQGDKEILTAVCENSPEGVTVAQIRIAIKTIDAIEEAGDVLLLDDEYHKYLLERFNATKFVKPERSILDLYDRLQ